MGAAAPLDRQDEDVGLVGGVGSKDADIALAGLNAFADRPLDRAVEGAERCHAGQFARLPQRVSSSPSLITPASRQHGKSFRPISKASFPLLSSTDLGPLPSEIWKTLARRPEGANEPIPMHFTAQVGKSLQPLDAQCNYAILAKEL